MDSLANYVCDDDHALQPFRAAGIAVSTVSWRAPDCAWDDFDLVIVRSTWDYPLDLARFFAVLADIDASRARLANPLAVLRWNANKRYLIELAADGVACVPTLFGATLTDAGLAQLQQHFGERRWIIKPQVGANAGDTFVMDARGTHDALALDRFAARGWLAQPFVDAVCADGEYSLIFFDDAFSHAIRKTPAANDFRVQEEHGGLIRRHDPSAELLAAGQRALRAVPGRCLYARVDLVRGNDAHWQVMEIELIEPSLYLRTDEQAAARLAAAVRPWLQSDGA